MKDLTGFTCLPVALDTATATPTPEGKKLGLTASWGPEAKITPLFAVEAAPAETLAAYVDGSCALAFRRCEIGTDVFLGVPELTAPFVRALARIAGVHLFTEVDASVWSADPYLSMHAMEDGAVTISTGRGQPVVDALEGTRLGEHPWLNIEDFETGPAGPCWKIKSNAASVLSDEERVLHGAGSLFSGRAASPGLEPAFLESVPEALGLEPNTTYAMSLDFRVEEEIGRDFYGSLYTYEEGQRQFIASLLSFREDKGYAGTATTSFTTHSEKSPYLGFHLRNWPNPAQPQGSLVVDNLRIRKLGAWRRDYDNGIVLCNPTSRPVRVQLEKPYRRIRGTQCPQVNDGSLVESVVLPAYDGLILTQGSTPSEHPG